jgi:hypothetical protein
MWPHAAAKAGAASLLLLLLVLLVLLLVIWSSFRRRLWASRSLMLFNSRYAFETHSACVPSTAAAAAVVSDTDGAA